MIEETVVNGLEAVKLTHQNGDTVLIYKLGATIASYIAKGHENIFVSTKAIYQNGKAIRFGPSEGLPQHGFARTNQFAISTKMTTSEFVQVTLCLEDTPETLKLWPFKFRIDYKVILHANSLEINFLVTNKDSKPFDFTCALHTYFHISDIANIRVVGLKGLKYKDKVAKTANNDELNDALTINQEVDREYHHAPNEITIVDNQRSYIIIKKNFEDIVPWNPYAEKARTIADLGQDDYRRFVCVETVQTSSPVVLDSGKTFDATKFIKSL